MELVLYCMFKSATRVCQGSTYRQWRSGHWHVLQSIGSCRDSWGRPYESAHKGVKPVNVDSPLDALEAALVLERKESTDNLGGSFNVLSLAGGLSC